MSNKVLYEDTGYSQYTNENIYACICPVCGLHIIEFSDYDIANKGDNLKEDFHNNLVYHGYEGRNQFCNRCGIKLDWS